MLTHPTEISQFVKTLVPWKKTVVMAHRGGSWGPNNSMHNFKTSVTHGIEGVETDVWLSKDGHPMVLHAKSDGELTDYGFPNDYVYEWTMSELLEKCRLENGEPLPRLEEFLDVYYPVETLINIELKGPLSPERKHLYDFERAAHSITSIVRSMEMHHKIMVSSFVPEIMEEMKKVTHTNRNFLLMQLLNRENKPEESYLAKGGVDGVNVSATYLTKEIIEKVHNQGKYVGVWFIKDIQEENEEFYKKIFELGPDFAYFDHPMEAMAFRDAMQKL